MDIYERIKSLAKSKGYSINSLEMAMGWSHSSIVKMKDQKTITPRIYQLAEFLDVPAEYLLNGETNTYYESKEASNLAQHLLDRPDHQVLFDAIKGVKPEDVEFVKQFIERVCDDKH